MGDDEVVGPVSEDDDGLVNDDDELGVVRLSPLDELDRPVPLERTGPLRLFRVVVGGLVNIGVTVKPRVPDVDPVDDDETDEPVDSDGEQLTPGVI